MSDGTLKAAEQTFMNNLATQSLRNEYMSKAQDIGSNAIRLVDDFFSGKVIDVVTPDGVDVSFISWTLTDLDRALDAIKEDIVTNYLKEFIGSAIDESHNFIMNGTTEEWKGLKS